MTHSRDLVLVGFRDVAAAGRCDWLECPMSLRCCNNLLITIRYVATTLLLDPRGPCSSSMAFVMPSDSNARLAFVSVSVNSASTVPSATTVGYAHQRPYTELLLNRLWYADASFSQSDFSTWSIPNRSSGDVLSMDSADNI